MDIAISPLDALHQIRELCAGKSPLGPSDPRFTLAVAQLAARGICGAAPSAPEAPYPLLPAEMPAEQALQMLGRLDEWNQPKRAAYRHGLVALGLADLANRKRELTPAQIVADQLLDVAIKSEGHLTSQFNEYLGMGANPEDYAHENPLAAELCALRALLGPLRPPAPPTLEEALDTLQALVDRGRPWLMSSHASIVGAPPEVLSQAREDYEKALNLLARVPK